MSKSLLPFVLAAVACTVGPVPSSDDDGPDDGVFYETVVTLGPDGVQVGEPHAITAAAQRRQHQHRLALERGDTSSTPDLDQDVCAGASLWLFSRTDWTGDKVCFKGCGSMALSDVPRFVGVDGVLYPIGSWVLSSGSYWPGAERGVLVAGTETYASSWIPFAAWGGQGRFSLGSSTIDGVGVGDTAQGENCPRAASSDPRFVRL